MVRDDGDDGDATCLLTDITSIGEVLTRQEFDNRKKQADFARLNRSRNAPKALASAGKEVSDSLFLQGM